MPTIQEEQTPAAETKAEKVKPPLAEINMLSKKALDYLDDLLDQE